MGAFGAAAMASITGRDLVCFGPELWPNIFTGFSRKDLAPGVACDIGALGKPARALIVAGISSPVDVVCAAHFSKLWGADVIYLDDCGHEAARELKARGQLEAMLGDFASGRNLDGYLQMSTKGAMVGRAATMAPADLDASTMLTFVTLLSPHLLAADAIRLVHYLVGRKVFLPALRLLEDIRKQFGEIAEMTLAECTALRKLKRYDEAIRLLKRIERHAFLRTHALFEKAMSLEAMGRREEAAATYGLLVREGTEGAIVRASVARIQALAA
ncbi:MAG: tetratricopeptide repeat protein [Comamonadaceae bacterium]|nr:MAG: tetratricopeptide repeat protein [Comamonadaceae bacterium]